MRILKYILLLLLLFSVAFVVFVATQKSDYNVVRTKEIYVSKDVIINFVSDSTSFEDWKPWADKGTISNEKNIISNDSVFQKITISEEKMESLIYVKKTSKGALVTWNLKGKLNFNLKMLSVIQGGVDKVIGNKLEEGLKNIDSYLVKELTTYKIAISGLVTKHATNYIQQIDTCSLTDFHRVSKNMLQNMMAFVDKNEIKIVGLPFITYESISNNDKEIIFAMCVPVEEEILTTSGSEISGGHFDEFLAAKVVLKGDYSHRKEAWEKARKYVKQKRLTEDNINGKFIEVYKVSLPKERKPSNWVTEIYVPVKKKVVVSKPKTETTEEGITTSTENKTKPIE